MQHRCQACGAHPASSCRFEPAPFDDNSKEARASGRKPTWRNTTIIRKEVVGAVRALKAEPGGIIMTDGSSQLVHELIANDLVDELHLLVYPVILGGGKRLFPQGAHKTFHLRSAKPYPSGVVDLHYTREAGKLCRLHNHV